MRTVAFDIGNVLYYIDLKKFEQYLIDANICEAIESSALIDLVCNVFDVGLCSLDHLLAGASEEEKQNAKKAWGSMIQRCNPMIEVVEELLDLDFNVLLLSNVGPDHAKIIKDEDPVLKQCELFLSCDIGARKPHHLFFQHVLWKLDKYSDKIDIYFDDKKENVDAAQNYFPSEQFNIKDFESGEEAADWMRRRLGLKY